MADCVRARWLKEKQITCEAFRESIFANLKIVGINGNTREAQNQEENEPPISAVALK